MSLIIKMKRAKGLPVPIALLTWGKHHPAFHPSGRAFRWIPAPFQGIFVKRLSVIAFSALTGASLWASGYGVGVQTAFDLGSGNAIAPRLEYIHYTATSSVGGPFAPIDLSATVNCFSLGVDYNYFLSGRTGKGFYVLAGLGVAVADINVTGSSPEDSANTTSRQTVVYTEAGVGYQFNRFLGLELLYKDLDFKDVTVVVDGVPVGYSFTASIQADVVVRF